MRAALRFKCCSDNRQFSMRDSREEMMKAPSTNASVPVRVDAKSNAAGRVVWRTSSAPPPTSGARSRLQEGESTGSAGTTMNCCGGSPFRVLLQYGKFHRTCGPSERSRHAEQRGRFANSAQGSHRDTSAEHLRPWPGSFTPAPCPVFSEPLQPDADAAATGRIHA